MEKSKKSTKSLHPTVQCVQYMFCNVAVVVLYQSALYAWIRSITLFYSGSELLRIEKASQRGVIKVDPKIV